MKTNKITLYANGVVVPQLGAMADTITSSTYTESLEHVMSGTWTPLKALSGTCSSTKDLIELRDVRYYDSAAIQSAGASLFTRGTGSLVTAGEPGNCDGPSEFFM